MDIDQIAQTIGTSFVTAWNAPIPFLAAMLVGWVIIRWFIKGQFETRLANADSTISLQDRQLNDYRDKLDGATPDEAKARLDALEQRFEERFNALAPRKLVDNQRQRMVEVLETMPGDHVTVAQDAAVADARILAQGIISAFNAARWTAEMPMVMGVGNPPASGIALRVNDPANLTAPQKVILKAFQEAGIEIDIQQGGAPHDMPGRPLSVAEILVTSRLI